MRKFESCHERMPQNAALRKLFEKQLCGLTQIFNRLCNGFALGRGSSFRIEGHIASFFRRCEHSCQLHVVNVTDRAD